MNSIRWMKVLISLVGISIVIKGVILARSGAFDQMVLLLGTAIWLTWIISAVFKNWDLPAPFAYRKGTNQVGRIAYCILVTVLFFLVIFLQ